jgi:hypothetical protein
MKTVICISRPRNHSLTYERKIVAEALAAETGNLKDVKELRGEGVHNIFVHFFNTSAP